MFVLLYPKGFYMQ